MPLNWTGNLDNLSDFEKNLDNKSKVFYEKYKDSIIAFFSNLEKENLLLNSFEQKDIDRLKKINEMSDAAFLLNRNVKHFFIKLEVGEKEDLLKKLIKLGFDADKNSATYQTVSVLCSAYLNYTEDIKKFMILLIKFDQLGVNDADKKPLGRLLGALEDNGLFTDFLKYIKDNNFIRNSVAHYSYYLNDAGKLVFCDGLLGKEEIKTISEFVDMTVDLNVLSSAFILIFMEKFVKVK